jgi:hypothetical protein
MPRSGFPKHCWDDCLAREAYVRSHMHLKSLNYKVKFLRTGRRVNLRTSLQLQNMLGMNGSSFVTLIPVFLFPRSNWEGIWVLLLILVLRWLARS